MRQIWSDTHRTACYLQIEAALARVQGRLGLIPAEAADEIDRVCSIERIDMALLKTQTERIGYPVLGVVSQINSLCRDQLGEYCHWGATTQDITDTATVLQIRAALDQRIGSIALPLPGPEQVSALAALKPLEDSLDALVCAWVGMEHLQGRTRGLGDSSAAIWCPEHAFR